LKYKNKIATNISIELTKVYKNKKYEALIFLSLDPKIPTIKYMGIKTASNNI